MATVAEDRSRAQGARLSLEDALHVFWEWHLASVRVEVSFLGKARPTEMVRVSIDGLVTLVDPEGIITISGEGREVRLLVSHCEFSRPNRVGGAGETFHSLDPATILQLTYPSGEICLVFPYRRVSPAPISRPRPASGLDWLRGKLARPPLKSIPAQDAPADGRTPKLVAQPRAVRHLFVDVRNGQANIVEVLNSKNGVSRIRRLREQFLPQNNRMEADRVKRRIICGENGGAYELDGLYRPKSDLAMQELTRLVEDLERQDGPHAWDRRRYPR